MSKRSDSVAGAIESGSLTDEEIQLQLAGLEAETNNQLDTITIHINERNYLTGKIKVHFDNTHNGAKHQAFSEAMEIIHEIQRINKPQHLKD